MLKSIFKAALVASAFAMVTSCSEEIDKGNRYTFTKETIADFLENDENIDNFSSLIKIYKQANMMGILQTYGNYTMFAPTNDAIDRYLFEQDSIWNATKNTDKPKWTGITSPYLEDLSDSMAVEFARTHLVPMAFELAEMSSDVLGSQNYNNRYLNISYRVENENVEIYINNQARISLGDQLLENGVVHVLDNAISSAADMICAQLQKYEYFSIFNEAIKKTQYEDKLQGYKDNSYDLGLTPAMCHMNVAGKGRYPHTKYIKYTIFAEPDSVFYSRGINDFADLEEYAQKWYGTEDADDYTSPKNAVNKFISYHILDREVVYDKLVMFENAMHNNKDFKQDIAFMDNMDRFDYFGTMYNKLIKVLMPLSNSDKEKSSNIWINPSRRTIPGNMDMRYHLDIKIYRLTEFNELNDLYADFSGNSLNGTIHPINKILIYNEEEMHGNVLNERMRFDFGTLLPELTTNNVRYAPWPNAGTLCGHGEYEIPDGYAKNLKILNGDTHVFYTSPYTWGCNYLGDEFLAIGKYDFAYKLPPVPAGTYELRVGYTANGMRSITQFYVDNKICGIPVDLRIGATDARIGYKADVADDTENEENDRVMRNHGYMKAGNSFTSQWQSGDGKKTARSYSNAIRKIITTMRFEGEHWIRIKKVDDIPNSQMNHDYIEIVPTSIVNSYIPEDRL